MKILNYCRHKTANWEGVLYKNDRKEIRVSNGLFDWPLTPERREKLEMVERIDVQKIISYLRLRSTGKPLILLLHKEASLENDGSLKNSFVDHFKPYTDVQALNHEIVRDVLKKVLIYPGQRVEIVWNYMDDYKSLVLELSGVIEDEAAADVNLPN